MRILHYSLGLAPYRSGGLTKYVNDLMITQSNNDNAVYLLFPGHMELFSNNTKIKYYCNYNNIKVYEIINPLPVPLLNGVKDVKKYTKDCDKKIFLEYLQALQPDIVNIHTFMGLNREFLYACKELNIKVVYTTHDYFGICPKVNLLDYENNTCLNRNLKKCIKCNKDAYSSTFVFILQSRVYRFMKNKGVINSIGTIRNIKISNIIRLMKSIKTKKNYINTENNNEELMSEYEDILNYYNSMFKLIDRYIFNSSVTKNIFNKFIDADGKIIHITHNSIRDNRKVKVYNKNEKLRITYLGPQKEYKGYYILCDIMESLLKKGYKDIFLNIYGVKNDKSIEASKNIKINGLYNYSMLKGIFDNTDFLIVPSMCFETFGFITLEALSYGVPVIVTDTVGSKDILVNDTYKKGIISSKNELEKLIIKIYNDRSILERLNEDILKDEFNLTSINHYKNIQKFYLDIIKNN